MNQPTLSIAPEPQFSPEHARFDGPEYVPTRDNGRLSGQISRVYNALKDGERRTLSQLAHITGDPEASISAQIRHLRKPRFGSNNIERQHRGHGLYAYRLNNV
jgi:hypothetical protein